MTVTSAGIRKAAGLSNLEQAWLWLRTNGDRTYKDYCRPLYRAYGLAVPERLQFLRRSLLDGTFNPVHTTKLYFPKKSGIQRPYSLLTVDDQIVYQALTNVIAERRDGGARPKYNRTVFGHQYGGPTSLYFYADWRRSYAHYTAAMRRAHSAGYEYTASFDLTACYDSIDHAVLRYFLKRLRFDEEFSSLFCSLLAHWTESSGGAQRIYHGHGIPQGPLASGLVAEVVLSHFDDSAKRKHLRYFRYVDDIRLFARDEISLRRELIQLDMKSKQIGLFPQSAKIDIHKVTDIEAEFKSVSGPIGRAVPTADGVSVATMMALTARFTVKDPTKFKFALGAVPLSSRLALRLFEIVRREPSLYEAAARYLSRFPRLSQKVTGACLDLIPAHDVYPAFVASFLRSLMERAHPKLRPRLQRYCRTTLVGPKSTASAELRAVATAVLAHDGVLTWRMLRYNVTWKTSWWARAYILQYIREDVLGRPSFQQVLQTAMADKVADPSLIATERLITNRCLVPTPVGAVHPASQIALKNAGRIGRIAQNECPIQRMMVSVLGAGVAGLRWRRVLPGRHYRLMIPRIAVWRGYAMTDPTAWVALTDTINDILLSLLFAKQTQLGGYVLGNIGSNLNANSRFAKAFPAMYHSAESVHRLRLEADLSHAVVRRTNAPTRRIGFPEMRRLQRGLAAGYGEVHANW